MNFSFDMEKMLTSLAVMGKGMLGIFIVTGVIILSVMLLNKLTSPKKKLPKDDSDGDKR